jgi:hypothetical protein
MKVTVQPFWLPKAGNTQDEYEDAFWLPGAVEQASAQFRLAVADGASTTSFSRLWATLLVEAYGTGAIGVQDMELDLLPLREQWLAIVGAKSLPWHAEMKVRRGAFSTLLGLTIEGESDLSRGRWSSVAVGDSCLVHLQGDEVRLTFPLTCSEAFQDNPHLIGSASTSGLVGEHVPIMEGAWDAADRFYLMTDALACWFISEMEAGRKPWALIEPLALSADADRFASFVAELRDRKVLRNDDVTLVHVAVTA